MRPIWPNSRAIALSEPRKSLCWKADAILRIAKGDTPTARQYQASEVRAFKCHTDITDLPPERVWQVSGEVA